MKFNTKQSIIITILHLLMIPAVILIAIAGMKGISIPNELFIIPCVVISIFLFIKR